MNYYITFKFLFTPRYSIDELEKKRVVLSSYHDKVLIYFTSSGEETCGISCCRET